METTKKETNLDHLVAGKRVKRDDKIYSLKGILLEDAIGGQLQVGLGTLNSDEYTLYQTPEELEIIKLQDIIKKQNEVIQELSKPKRGKQVSHKRLSADELEDLHTQFELGKKPVELFELFGIGRSTCDAKHREWRKLKGK